MSLNDPRIEVSIGTQRLKLWDGYRVVMDVPCSTSKFGLGTQSDLVLTRILWLGGTQPHNANTFERYIYIHGTNDETRIGRAMSHGCVRLRNADVIKLFDLVPLGTTVWISE